MAKIVKVEYGLESSVKIRDYVYCKPRVVLTAIVEDNDKYEDVFDAVKAKAHEMIAKDEKRCIEVYRPLHPGK